MTLAEKKAFFGRSKSVKQNHAPKSLMSSETPVSGLESLPKNVDWRNANIVTAVKDQGTVFICFCCSIISHSLK
jgi:C1A family cysteine protease